MRHPLLILLFLVASCAAETDAGLPRVHDYRADEHFDPAEAVSGSFGTRVQCALTPQALWVTVSGHADCLRYYAGGALEEAPKVVVFLDGDVLEQVRNRTVATPDYGEGSPRTWETWATSWAWRTGLPTIYLARPGTMGSSGNQNERRQQAETLELNAALDQLKARYHIGQFGLAGQSGGGGLVAALIAERSDVLCAVSFSGVVAIATRNALRGIKTDATGYTTVWDPIAQVGRVRQGPDFRLFLLGDPADAQVPFGSQLVYADAATEAGLHPIVIQAIGTGRDHHLLAQAGLPLTADCLDGTPTDALIAKYQRLR